MPSRGPGMYCRREKNRETDSLVLKGAIPLSDHRRFSAVHHVNCAGRWPGAGDAIPRVL